MAKSSVERSREYRARKKAMLTKKAKTAMTPLERKRLSRSRKKLRDNQALNLTTLSTSNIFAYNIPQNTTDINVSLDERLAHSFNKEDYSNDDSRPNNTTSENIMKVNYDSSDEDQTKSNLLEIETPDCKKEFQNISNLNLISNDQARVKQKHNHIAENSNERKIEKSKKIWITEECCITDEINVDFSSLHRTKIRANEQIADKGVDLSNVSMNIEDLHLPQDPTESSKLILLEEKPLLSPNSPKIPKHLTRQKILKQKLPVDTAEQILSLIGEKLSNTRCIPVEDEYDAVGKNIAAKLRKLPDRMKIIAEKLFHDIIYHAQMGTLTSETSIVVSKSYSSSNFVNELERYQEKNSLDRIIIKNENNHITTEYDEHF